MVEEPEQPQERQEFASALFNEDLKDLLVWHKERTPIEQRKFLKSLDKLYGAARVHTITPSVDETLHVGTERASLPDIQPPSSTLRPIDMFLQKQKDARMRKSVTRGDMEMWLDQKSCSSDPVSMASSWTEWTEMTPTTVSSFSGVEPTTKNSFKRHRRALAVNRRRWNATCVHDSTDNLPNDGFPELLRFRTTTGGAYGDVKKGAKPINEKMYDSLFKDENHPFISEYLGTASPRTRDEFCQMVRCLEQLRLNKTERTSHQRDFNLKEQNKLWVPLRARPRNKDVPPGVPLGTIQEMIDFHRDNTGQTVKLEPMRPLTCNVLTLDGPDAVASLEANAPFLETDASTVYSES